ncbi:MAG TPA: NUDIX domain-containing protein [Bacteroidetes bacterium]|nr:NUDIX domain-containing protein [Bacteroidota bacterium]
MAKEYSVFFDSRKIVLTSNFDSPLKNREGLFVAYQTPLEFAKLLVFFQTSAYPKTLYVMGADTDSMLSVLSSHFMNIIAAGGLVKNSIGQLLLIKRNGIWDLPKGKAEDGESPESTAIREVEEECGLGSLQIEKHLVNTYHTYKLDGQWVLKKSFWYSMVAQGNTNTTPQQIEGITDAVWVDPNDLPVYLANTFESIKLVFDAAQIH